MGHRFLHKIKRPIAIWLAACLFPAIAFSQEATTPPEVQAANDGVYVFTQACLHNLPKLEGVRDWAAAKNLPVINASAARNVYVGDGDDGIGWFLHGEYVNTVLSIRAKTGGCAVYLDHADPNAFAKWYDIILKSLATPQGAEIIKTPEPDKVTDGNYGQRTGKVRAIYKNGETLMLVMITNEKPGGAYQDSIQITVIPQK